jgi:protein SCO1/2
MEHLQAAFKSDPSVELVSFTVDPDDDTPAVLSTYANLHHADPNKWLFLTGKEADIDSLMSDGFTLVVSDNRGQALQPGQFLFTHSTQIVLVDSQGVIRQYFDGTDSEGTLVSDVKGAVHQLENE